MTGRELLRRHLRRIGRKGGLARARNLTPEQMSAIGRKGGKRGGRGRKRKPDNTKQAE
jgi:general stress protein YciG